MYKTFGFKDNVYLGRIAEIEFSIPREGNTHTSSAISKHSMKEALNSVSGRNNFRAIGKA
ncbi:hypothetical protein [Palaeococcus sp. (in: euryarchaeotes)]